MLAPILAVVAVPPEPTSLDLAKWLAERFPGFLFASPPWPSSATWEACHRRALLAAWELAEGGASYEAVWFRYFQCVGLCG